MLTALASIAACASPPARTCAPPPGRWQALPIGAPASPDVAGVWDGERLFVLDRDTMVSIAPCEAAWRTHATAGRPDWLASNLAGNVPVVAADEHRLAFVFPGSAGNFTVATSAEAAFVYDADADAWTTLPRGAQGAPVPRIGAAIGWIAGRLVVWGGVAETTTGTLGDVRGDGAAVDPATGRWQPLATAGAPPGAAGMGFVRWGDRLVVWGGLARSDDPYQLACRAPRGTKVPGGGCAVTRTGGIYDAATDTWEAMATEGAPTARQLPSVAVWNDRIVVAGGWPGPLDGGVYDPRTRTWTPLPVAPEGGPVSLDGDHLVVWTGAGAAAVLDLRRPRAWRPVAGVLPPSARYGLVPLGARGVLATFEDEPAKGWIARVDPVAARWVVAPFPAEEAPPLTASVAAWTGESLLVWGGRTEVVVGTSDCAGPSDPDLPVCDPSPRFEAVHHATGGLLVPAFAPAHDKP